MALQLDTVRQFVNPAVQGFLTLGFQEATALSAADVAIDEMVGVGLPEAIQGRSYADAVTQAVSSHIQSDRVRHDPDYTQEMLDADIIRVGQEAIINHIIALPDSEQQIAALRELDTHSGSGANAAIFNQLEANPELLNAFTSALAQDDSFRAGFVEGLTAEGGSAIDPAALEKALANPALSGALTTALTNIATNPEIGQEQFQALTTAVSAMNGSEGFEAVEAALVGLGIPAEEVATIRTAAVDAEVERIASLPHEQQIDALRALDTEGAHTALIDALAGDEVLLESFTNAMQQDPSFREGITRMMTSEGEGGISSEMLAEQLANPVMRAQLAGILDNIAQSEEINYGQFEALSDAIIGFNDAEGFEGYLTSSNNMRNALLDLGLEEQDVAIMMAAGATQAMTGQVGGAMEMMSGFIDMVKEIFTNNPAIQSIMGHLEGFMETISEFMGMAMEQVTDAAANLGQNLGLSGSEGADIVGDHMDRNGYGALEM